MATAILFSDSQGLASFVVLPSRGRLP